MLFFLNLSFSDTRKISGDRICDTLLELMEKMKELIIQVILMMSFKTDKLIAVIRYFLINS